MEHQTSRTGFIRHRRIVTVTAAVLIAIINHVFALRVGESVARLRNVAARRRNACERELAHDIPGGALCDQPRCQGRIYFTWRYARACFDIVPTGGECAAWRTPELATNIARETSIRRIDTKKRKRLNRHVRTETILITNEIKII